MKILQSKESYFPIIQNFMEPYEYNCVQLAMYVRHQNEHVFVISNKDEIKNEADILGIIHCDGNLTHCIPDLNKLQGEEFKQAFSEFLLDKQVKCLTGDKDNSQILVKYIEDCKKDKEGLSPVTPYQTFIYDLMILQDEPLPPNNPLSCDDYIKRCTEDDLESLIDIQKKYIIKEVAPIGKQISDMEAAMSLRHILKNQLALALLADEEIVAKANSNAIGWHWVQIGGVFTHPLYRRNSYAWHLVYDLCRRIRKTQRNVCLFVKEKNAPAMELYKKIGFTPVGKYQISYFN